MKQKVVDYLVYDEKTGKYREDPEQAVRDDVEKHHWKHVGLTILKDWRLYLMLIPMLLVFFFWRYMPMYELLSCFKVYDANLNVADQLYSGFSYFAELFNGKTNLSIDFWRAFRNTFVISFYGLCFGFPMPIIIALFFNEIKSNIARSVYQVLTYLPKFISTVVMTTLVSLLVRQSSSAGDGMEMGVISQLLLNLGVITEEVGNAGLLNNPDFFRPIYQITGIWETAGYDSIVFFAAIIAISPTSYEAAQIAFDTKQYKTAADYLRPALVANPKSRAQADLMGRILFYQRQTINAKLWYERALRLTPNADEKYRSWVQQLPEA